MKILTPAKLSAGMFLVVIALVGAYVVKGLLAVDEPPAQPTTRLVPMAIADLAPGTVITEAHIGQGPISNSALKPDMLLSNRVLVGRIVKEAISAAKPIRSGQLYQPGERPRLEVEPGSRAVSVRVGDSTALVDGLIQPDDYVDVHMTTGNQTFRDERLRGGLSLTLFQGVKVLAISQGALAGNVGQSGQSVTLELTTAQANILNIARDRGIISLTFNPDGKGNGVIGVDNENRATLDEILNLQPIPPPEPPEPPEPPITVEIYRQSGRQQIEFRNGRRISDYSPIVTPNTVIQPPTARDSVAPIPNDDAPRLQPPPGI